MTKFEDQLLGQLMTEHGHRLQAAGPPAPARRRGRRPAWLAAGAAGAASLAGLMAALMMTLGSAPAYAAYSVTRQAGTVSVSVGNAAGVTGANAALRAMRSRVVVVPVRRGCPPIGSLPRPRPAPHPAVRVKSGPGRAGHRSVSVRIKGGLPAGDTMVLAFSGNRHGGSVGAGGIITGPVPRCVSLPRAPAAPAAHSR